MSGSKTLELIIEGLASKLSKQDEILQRIDQRFERMENHNNEIQKRLRDLETNVNKRLDQEKQFLREKLQDSMVLILDKLSACSSIETNPQTQTAGGGEILTDGNLGTSQRPQTDKTVEGNVCVSQYNSAIDTLSQQLCDGFEDMRKTVEEVKKIVSTDVANSKNDIIEKMTTNTKSLSIELSKSRDQVTEKMKANTTSLSKDEILIPLKGEITKLSEKIQQSKQETVTELENSAKEMNKKMENTLDKKLQYGINDIYAMIEKESQLSRDAADFNFNKAETYHFYFRVQEFTDRVGSGVRLFSHPWYVDQFKTSVKGYVWFNTNGNITVMLLNGRYPKVVGLQPKEKKRYKFTVSVVDNGEKNEKVLMTESNGYIDESEANIHYFGWGYNIGNFPCDDFTKEGYIFNDTLVLKFSITPM